MNNHLLLFIIVILFILIKINFAQSDYFMVDKSPVFIPEPGYQGTPSVAFNGTNYFAVWGDNRAAYASMMIGTFITQEGNVLNPAGKLLLTSEGNKNEPAAAFDGNNFLIVWRDDRNGEDDIYGARILTAGSVLDPGGIPITIDTDYQETPDVIFDRNQYIVAWFGKADELNLKGAEIDLSGNITNTYTVSDQFGLQTYPSLAHGPEDQVLVIYQGFATEYQNTNYNAQRTWGTFLGLYVGVENENSGILDDFILYQNYPNPFNPSTKIRFTIPNTPLSFGEGAGGEACGV